MALDTPLDPRGTEISAATIKWEWAGVSGASEYSVVVDGEFKGYTSQTSFLSHDLWTGNHSMTVQALDSNRQYSSKSQTAITFANSQLSPGLPATATAPSSGGSMIDPSSYNYPEVYQVDGYELTFSDEFNTSSLDTNRWNTQLPWDGDFNGVRYEYRTSNGEDQFYVNPYSDDIEHTETIALRHNPFKFNGSTLSIQAIKNPLKTSTSNRTYGGLEEMYSQQEFLSGVIASDEKFSQKYGYFEARLKIPGHTGAFPAFWLLHERKFAEDTQRTEIDVMENLGHSPEYIYNSFHYFKNVSDSYSGDGNFLKPTPSGQVFTGIDYSEEFHTYAVKWDPSRITWFIDGQQVSELSSGEINYEELYVILNLAIGGNWTNFPESAGGLGRENYERFPTQDDLNRFTDPSLEIDYVRVYKRR